MEDQDDEKNTQRMHYVSELTKGMHRSDKQKQEGGRKLSALVLDVLVQRAPGPAPLSSF